MALAAALIEYVYAAIAIKFQIFITSSPAIKENFQLITAVVLLALGGVNLLALRKKKGGETKPPVMASSGFRKGVLLSIGNPLAMPFWIAITAYLQSNSWVNFDDVPIWSYVLGISLGTLSVLSLLGLLSYKTGKFIKPDNKLIKIIPGIVLITLGLYSLILLYF
jgi:threonine/homoserine/homoserine lactone efflux protein